MKYSDAVQSLNRDFRLAKVWSKKEDFINRSHGLSPSIKLAVSHINRDPMHVEVWLRSIDECVDFIKLWSIDFPTGIVSRSEMADIRDVLDDILIRQGNEDEYD